ncbi:hypothetical protein [uncultured Algimonas sp.]|uniref:hypothetical protein n=1 Tax=uncultured Algimonas sp. TaxID=1547920 RepID=UPI00260F6AC9|nr:hypothetical protein [uncultured Algimonas sp.]
MKTLLIAALGATLVPLSASAHCLPSSAGSASVSCEQGVRVVRQSPGALPRLDLAVGQQAALERQRLAARHALATRQARLQAQRLWIERERVRNQGYLYRDANSPLRARRGRTSGSIVVVPGR